MSFLTDLHCKWYTFFQNVIIVNLCTSSLLITLYNFEPFQMSLLKWFVKKKRLMLVRMRRGGYFVSCV